MTGTAQLQQPENQICSGGEWSVPPRQHGSGSATSLAECTQDPTTRSLQYV